MTDWDGTERRKDNQLVAAIGTPKVNGKLADRSVVLMVMGAVIVALQVLTLLNQFGLASNQRAEATRNRQFRDAVVCFVVESFRTPGSVPPDLLTKCGFIVTPGGR
jgi:hypothetical protein